MLGRDLAQDLAFALDPARVAVEMGLDPDPWQARFLRTPGRRILLNCTRQSGKSTVTALLAAHTALYDPGALVLLLSPTQRQSHELFRKALDAYHAVPTAIPVVQESALRLELSNGSRIVSLPGKETTVRGFSGVRLLAVDEAARVADELYYSVRPMLAVSGGRLVALSTPFGTRG
ncbi:MAG TPA: terminase family protein, partial [Thermoanaerobaculia bacterium]|nr:terminase family protein [Thermoanaerobaculia bacterium]